MWSDTNFFTYNFPLSFIKTLIIALHPHLVDDIFVALSNPWNK
jgi:hypothetical protein